MGILMKNREGNGSPNVAGELPTSESSGHIAKADSQQVLQRLIQQVGVWDPGIYLLSTLGNSTAI